MQHRLPDMMHKPTKVHDVSRVSMDRAAEQKSERSVLSVGIQGVNEVSQNGRKKLKCRLGPLLGVLQMFSMTRVADGKREVRA